MLRCYDFSLCTSVCSAQVEGTLFSVNAAGVESVHNNISTWTIIDQQQSCVTTGVGCISTPLQTMLKHFKLWCKRLTHFQHGSFLTDSNRFHNNLKTKEFIDIHLILCIFCFFMSS